MLNTITTNGLQNQMLPFTEIFCISFAYRVCAVVQEYPQGHSITLVNSACRYPYRINFIFSIFSRIQCAFISKLDMHKHMLSMVTLMLLIRDQDIIIIITPIMIIAQHQKQWPIVQLMFYAKCYLDSCMIFSNISSIGIYLSSHIQNFYPSYLMYCLSGF